MIYGSVASAGLAIVSSTRVAAGAVTGFFSLGANAGSGYDIAFSLALLGAGHLVGLSVGMAMLTGLIISWAGAVPILTHLQPAAAGVDLAAQTEHIWRHQVRFIGAGTIAISAIWTLAKLAGPVVGGLVGTITASRATATDDERDRDLSRGWIIGLTVLCLALSAWLAIRFVRGTPLESDGVLLALMAVPFVLVGGFVIAAICGYMAGLIGASNSPVSGVGILSIVSCATVLALVFHPTAETRPALVAVALFVTAIVFACATISNDNLQDLKTGQLVGASPRRQQIALIVGVIAGAAVIPPILNLLAQSNGFAGAPNVGVIAQNPLPAPQATLISALAQGVKNLCKLVSLGYMEGFYYKPRIDKELLQEFNGGLIALSACLQGEVSQALHYGLYDKAKTAAESYAAIFGDRYYIEIQDNKLPEQEKVNPQLVELAKELSLPVVATNDCHYGERADFHAHDVLLCVQTGKTITEENRLKLETDELYLKSAEEMMRGFDYCPGAVARTLEIAERCNVEIEFGKYHFPNFTPPKEISLDNYLDELAP